MGNSYTFKFTNCTQCFHSSLYVKLNKVNRSIFIRLISTDADFQIVSSRLRKLLAEPRKVWRITAWTFKSITTLSIPQWVIRVENNRLPWTTVKCCLTVVVRAHKIRRRCSTTTAWTGRCFMIVFPQSSCICPDVLPWTGSISYANPINIRTVNGAGSWTVFKSIC